MITQIRKRNGNLVQFDKDKISCAITKANHSVQDEVISQTSLKKLTDKIVDALPKNQVPSVEQVQDIVEAKHSASFHGSRFNLR